MPDSNLIVDVPVDIKEVKRTKENVYKHGPTACHFNSKEEHIGHTHELRYACHTGVDTV